MNLDDAGALKLSQSSTGHWWKATCDLRFEQRTMGKTADGFGLSIHVLQQRFQSDTGKSEWRDVPQESEKP